MNIGKLKGSDKLLQMAAKCKLREHKIRALLCVVLKNTNINNTDYISLQINLLT
jgi:hypothetical protein